jgi:hypothetical protein
MSPSPLDALPLFFAMLVLTELGRKLHARTPEHKSSSAIEGAIFGLFGLHSLVYFSLSLSPGPSDATTLIASSSRKRSMILALPISALISCPKISRINSARTFVPTSPHVSIVSIRKKVSPSAKTRSGFRRSFGQVQLKRP